MGITAAAHSLLLQLPIAETGRNHTPGQSTDVEEASSSPRGEATTVIPALAALEVEALEIAPGEAFRFLLREDMLGGELQRSDSLRYWSKVAGFLAELLVRQRFVPALHRAAGGRLRGFWRVVLDDAATSRRLSDLIESMPPVCRSVRSPRGSAQASELVENFLWTLTDAVVRRCIGEDEIADSLRFTSSESQASPAARWLASVVGDDPWVVCEREEANTLHETIAAWLGKLEPDSLAYGVRTCLRLHVPEDAPDTLTSTASDNGDPSWKLTVHAQARHDPQLIIDADRLADQPGDDPRLLPRPFTDARRQLREDLHQAAQHVPALAPCAEPGGPWECRLNLAEAYTFLKEAAPRLEAEGIRIFQPQGWRAGRSRLQLWLDLSPAEDAPLNESRIGLDALVRYNWRVAIGDEELTPEEWQALTEAKLPLVRFRGDWLEMNPAQLRAAGDFVRRHPDGRMTVFEALRQTYIVEEAETGVPVAGMRGQGWVELLLNSTESNHRVESVPVPAAFHGVLRPYQREGLDWLAFLGRLGMGACLADDMGLGKTIQLIALLLHERENPAAPPGPTLLIVPMSLVGNWHREIVRFAPSVRILIHHGLGRLTGETFVEEAGTHDVVVSTYGLAHRDHEFLSRVNWHRIALDEAQNIKNPSAKQSAAVRSLPAVHRVALTGTPLENRLAELWSIIDFLNPGYLGGPREFRRRFAAPIEKQKDQQRATRLRQLIRPFVLRRLKSDPHIVEELPPKLEMTVFCNLTREQAALYDAVVKDMLAQIDDAGGMRRRGLILATLVKLKQICNHPAHYLSDGSPLPHRSGKCERLTEMLEEVLAEGDRALVFTQFREMGSLLQAHLHRTLGSPILFLHGGTPERERNRLVERFQSGNGEAPVFLLSLKAGGFGLNLTAANHVFHFDRWWNPAVEDQATDRTHRIGQTRQVQVHKFVSIGTLEERIAAMMEEKRNLAERIIGSGEEWLTELSTDALRELFALSREAVVEE